MRYARGMWRPALIAIVLLACGTSPAKPAETPAQCNADLEHELDRSCRVPSDCVLVNSADCCGPVVLAVRAGTEGSFAAAEATYEACLACPPSGCDHPPVAEDGQTPGPGQTIAAACLVDACQSIVQ